MKSLFNAVCSACQQFRPRCCWTHPRLPGAGQRRYDKVTRAVLCGDCRRERRGTFCVAAGHQ